MALNALRDIGAEGLNFTKQSKDEALANLQAAFDMHEIEYPEIIVEFDELKFYGGKMRVCGKTRRWR